MSSRAWKRRYTSGDTVVVFINPNTRTDHMQIRAALGQWVPDGVNLRIYETRRNVSTNVLAKEMSADADGVIACGGDGTVSEVAAALEGRNIPLGIIPAGSTNIIAQELGIPQSVSAAAALAFGPFDVHEMDVGTCNEHYFLHMAGTGIDSRIFDSTDESLKRRIGWMAYVPSALRAVWDSSRPLRITIDDEEHSVVSPLVLIANGSSVISSAFRIDDSIRSDDGQLDVLIVTATKPHELAMVVAQAANPLAEIRDSPYVIQRKARTIRVESDKPQPIQLDGDVSTHTPAIFGVLPRAIGISVRGGRRR
jgi:YegS/Rv2252/BmrU family lipid kinase